MRLIVRTLAAFLLLEIADQAPVSERQAKNLAFLDYLQPDVDYNNYEVDNDDYVRMALEENELSRTIPSRKTVRPYNSPIYYIRLPPQPYMFVPGLGYMSQPPPSPVSQFVNLPVSFVANGKPSNIYQWSGAFQGFPTQAPPVGAYPGFPSQQGTPIMLPKPMKKPLKKPLGESTIHRLPGTYAFNGKPEDIFVLRDSYNSLYSDVLQNVYP